MAVVNEIGATKPESAEDQVRLAAFLFAHGDLPSAANVFGNAIKFRPDDAEALANYGVVLSRLRRLEEAHELLSRALKIAPEVPNTHDALASVSYRMKRFDDARHHGETALKLKDDAVAKTGTAHPVPDKLAQFSPDDPSLNIIAFSLWGDGEKYLNGALENARLAPDIYPHWRCRFYCDDTVPEAVRDQLKTLGAEVVMMNRVNPFDGLFWRFLPANDGRTRHFLVRDADSIINSREQAAVERMARLRQGLPRHARLVDPHRSHARRHVGRHRRRAAATADPVEGFQAISPGQLASRSMVPALAGVAHGPAELPDP